MIRPSLPMIGSISPGFSFFAVLGRCALGTGLEAGLSILYESGPNGVPRTSDLSSMGGAGLTDFRGTECATFGLTAWGRTI